VPLHLVTQDGPCLLKASHLLLLVIENWWVVLERRLFGRLLSLERGSFHHRVLSLVRLSHHLGMRLELGVGVPLCWDHVVDVLGVNDVGHAINASIVQGIGKRRGTIEVLALHPQECLRGNLLLAFGRGEC